MSGILQGRLAALAGSADKFILFTWGRNNRGQLGIGNTLDRSSPVQVGALTNWAQVSAGGDHTACTQAN